MWLSIEFLMISYAQHQEERKHVAQKNVSTEKTSYVKKQQQQPV